jgi:polysaccharide biosynthesis transport protein
MGLGQFFSILRARWWVALLLFGLTVGIALAVSLRLPKQYQAAASVVLEVRPDPVSNIAMPGVTQSFVATQVDVIQSDRVAQRVVRNLKLAENLQFRSRWLEETGGQGAIENWLAETFQKNLEVRPSRESNVISVAYKETSPRVAAALANAFVQAYIETSLELRVDPARQYTSFFDKRSNEAREALEKAQTKLSAFQRAKGIIGNDDRLDVETTRMNELSSQLVMLQALTAESSSRQSQGQGAAAAQTQEVLNNGLIAGLKAEASRAEAKLQELNARLGDRHPQVVEARASITELRSRIETETRRVSSSVGINNNVNRAREAEVRASLESQRTKVLKIKSLRDESAVMVRELENAQRTYDAVLARLTQTSLESQATQSSVNILTQATPPLRPSSPKVVLNVLLAAFVGGLLAMGATFLFELLDRRVRSLQDLVQTINLPVMGVMPRPDRRRLFGKPSVTLLEKRVMQRLPSPGQGAV